MKISEKWKDSFLVIFIFILTLFVGIFKISDIPPGTQDDVLRAVITSEQYLQGLDGGLTSLRQSIAYFLLGGHWSSYFVDLARGYGNVDAMLIISRLPSLLFFLFGTLIWYRILETIELKRFGKFIFFLIFVPSAYFSTYSHHIPLVAGYFFFGSAGILYLLKFFKEEVTRFSYLFLSMISFGLITYTHGISIFFCIGFLTVFCLLILLLKTKDVKRVIKTLFKGNKLKYALIIILFLLSLYPFIDGFLASDSSLKSRDANTVKYLIDLGEIDLLKDKMIEKYRAYFHPNTLVFSGKIVEGIQPVDSRIFYDIKNPQFNQWVTTNLSPFGFVSILSYLAIILVFINTFKNKDYKNILALSLFITYLIVIAPTNYDNPSIAKVIVPIIWIPLSISIIIENIVNSTDEKIYRYLLTLFVIVSSIYNLSYLYLPGYSRSESDKYYQYNFDSVFSYILKSSELSKLRVFVKSNNSGITNLISFYLGPNALNRSVFGEFEKSFINEEEYSYFITDNREDFAKFESIEIREFSTPDSPQVLYLGVLKPNDKSMGNEFINYTEIKCLDNLYYPIRLGEFELTQYQYRYYNQLGYYSEKCKSVNSSKNIDPYDLRIVNNNLISKDIFSGKEVSLSLEEDEIYATKKYSLIDRSSSQVQNNNLNSFTLEADNEDSTMLLKLSAINPLVSTENGTYLLQFDYDIDKYGYLDFYAIDAKTGIAEPTNIIYQNYHPNFTGKYLTILYLGKGDELVFNFTAINKHYNIDKSKHKIKVSVNNIKVTHISKINILEENNDTERVVTNPINIIQPFPGIYKLETSQKTEEVLVLNRTYTEFLNTDTLLVNGIVPGVRNNGYGEILISKSVVYGAIALLLNLSWITYLSMFRLLKRERIK